MADPATALTALHIVAQNQRQDGQLLGALATVSRDTRASAVAVQMLADPSVAQFVAGTETEFRDNVRDFKVAALDPRPFHKYHANHRNEINEQNFPGGAVTARSLVLGRFTTVAAATDRLYGADNYTTCLGFSHSDLTNLGGRKLLDVGCGFSIFPAEAKALYDINVQGIDLNADPEDVHTKKEVFKQYVKNLIFTRYIANTRRTEIPPAIDLPLVDRCLARVHETNVQYVGGDRLSSGDATRLTYASNV